MTKKQKKELLKEVLSLFREYSLCAQSWDPKKEGDYKDLKDSLKELIDEN